MERGGERKRKSPLELDWDKLLGQDNDEDPVLLAKPAAKLAEEKSMTDGGEEPSRDDHFRQTSDKELVIEIGRMKRIYPSFAANLPDRGEKFLAIIKRFEEELERRERKRKSTLELDWDKLLGKEEDEDPVLSAKPAAKLAEEKSMNDGGEEPSKDDHFRQTSDEELIIEIGRMKRTYPSLAANLPDRGENFLASIKRHEEELERRKHQKANGRCKKPTQSTDPTFVAYPSPADAKRSSRFSYQLPSSPSAEDRRRRFQTPATPLPTTTLTRIRISFSGRKEGCKNYETLGEIFSGITATGGLGNASTQLPPTSDEERDLEDAFLTGGVHVHMLNDDGIDDIGKTRRREEIGTSGGGRRQKEPKTSKSDKLEACMAQFSSTMSMRSEENKLRKLYLQEKLAKLQGKSRIPSDSEASSLDIYSTSACLDILNDMDDVSNEMYAKAITKFKDPDFRMSFVKMPASRRGPVLEFV